MPNVSIIGAGRVGGALALALSRAGYSIVSLYYRGDRHLSTLKSELPSGTKFISGAGDSSLGDQILIIASGDPDIAEIAKHIAGSDNRPAFAFHTSGSLSSTILDDLKDVGVKTASFHPLAAISDPVTGSERFRGAFFCIEGDTDAVGVGNSIAVALGGKPFSIPTEAKPVYHAAAVMSAGHLVALMDIAIELMGKCGILPDEARRILNPLAAGSIANLAAKTPAEALTGPYARGDAAALERHLVAFAKADVSEEIRKVYLDLAARSVELSSAPESERQLLRKCISMAKQKAE